MSYLPITDPTWIFFVVLSIILFAPMLLERLRIPSIVGMIFAGVLIGPHGFHILDRDGSFELFGKVGLYYIMFLASLEMNMQDVKKIQGRALTLGLLGFAFPMLIGFAANTTLLGYGIAAAVLMAAMYASHTLVSYPIVLRYGLSRRKCVSIAVGGTIVADTLTLLVLAVVGGLFKEDVGPNEWIWLLGRVTVLGALIILIFPRLARWFFRRYDDGVVQYIFVLVLVFLGAGLMEFVGMEGILGAFLAGIVLNRSIPPASPLMNHIEFVGTALFIPYFLIGVGLLINVVAAERSRVLFLEIARALDGRAEACPFHGRLAQNLLQICARKNLLLSRRILHTSSKTIRGRLLSYFSEQAQKSGSHQFTIPFNRQQLADYLNVDRSALSAELSKMKAEGILDYEKNTFVLSPRAKN